MKKDKEQRKTEDEGQPDIESVELLDQEKPASEPDIDMEALKLGEIESTEVVPDDHIKESTDPDKEVKIKALAIHPIWWKRRSVRIAGGIGLFVLLLLIIPFTRFLLIGWAWHESVVVNVTDAGGSTPVSNALVSIGGQQATTDGDGAAIVTNIPIGYHSLKIEKKNYKTVEKSVTVDIFSSLQKRIETMATTGKLVPLRITDRLSGKPIAEAVVAKGSTIYGKTDANGKVTVVVPISSQKLDATVTIGKYNVLSTTITPKSTELQLIPSGHLYFLSKQSGKIDVIKTNLDGSDRRTVVAGTGDENDRTTTLLASRDWKYLAFKTKRTPNKPEVLYVIDTSDDSYKVVDEADAMFGMIGWIGHSFVYEAHRNTGAFWQAKTIAIKGYEAEKGTLNTLDENASVPESTQYNAFYEQIGNSYIVNDRLLYSKVWTRSGSGSGIQAGDKQSVIASVAPNGTARKVLKSFSPNTVSAINARMYQPQGLYYQMSSVTDEKPTYGQLDNGAYKNIPDFDEFYSKIYPSYLVSPNGTATFWAEERDGKNALFTGGGNADNKVQLTAASEYKAYGWLTDDWLLVQKKDSELYITTKEQLKAGGQPLKVSDYHRTAPGQDGYNSGYGGM